MSRRDNMKRIFVGNLPPDVRTRDLEDLFYKFGKIAFIDLKTRRGPPFAFVEFMDYRDAEEAVRCRDGKDWDGCRLRVEFPRGRERPSRFKNGAGSGSRSSAPQRRSKFRVKVTGLPTSGSWQDLKDHMREVGEVCFADVYKGGEGVVEFVSYDDMRYAIRKLNNTKFKSHEGESSYIKLREDVSSGGDSRSRSRSPVTTRRRGSPSYSPVAKRRVSHSPSRSISRSPRPRRDRGHHKRSTRRGRSDSRTRSVSRSRSHSRSPSASPRSARGSSRASRDRSRSNSKSVSRSPRYNKSPARSDKRVKSEQRSPSPTGDRLKRSPSKDNNIKESRSRSRSKSRSSSRSASRSPSRSVSRSPVANTKRTPSRTPSRTPTPDRNGSPAKD